MTTVNLHIDTLIGNVTIIADDNKAAERINSLIIAKLREVVESVAIELKDFAILNVNTPQQE